MLTYLPFAATQGSADAFVEAAVSTGLSGTNQSYRLRELILEVPAHVNAVSDLQVQFNRRSKSAIASLADPDIFFYWRRQLHQATQVSIITYERVMRWVFSEDEDVRIVEDTIYMELDSSGSGAANTVTARLGFQPVKISETERLSLLVRSLG